MKVESDSRKGLFRDAGEGLMEFTRADWNVLRGQEVRRGVEIDGSVDSSMLIIDFLNELLRLLQTYKEVYQTITIKELSETELEADLVGIKIADGFDEDIKAVAYHGVKIEKNDKGNYEVTIIFDI